jgi:arabinogalactan oligomer / maltooligosaccharide transport system permease protein
MSQARMNHSLKPSGGKTPPIHAHAKLWRSIHTTLTRLILILICVAALFPAVWVITASFSAGTSLYSGGLIPEKTTLNNYLKLFSETDFLLWMKNSLIICTSSSFLTLFLTVTMGYSFSRFRFAGRRFGLLALILIQMFPSIMSIVAVFRLLQIIGLLDSYWGLVLVYSGGGVGFNAWLLKGYIDSIPKEMDEAARMDGASHWQAFTKIVLPLATPMLAVIFLFNFIGFFQEFLLANIILFNPDLRPIAVGMRFYINGNYAQNWTGFAAASIIASIPVLVIFFSLQRFLVEGLTKGALKG